MAVKTDMSKAYDGIEWGFVKEVLKLLGFDPVWINWIMACIESVSYSFLINESPQGLVKPSRGLRQGDPLSPHIFILYDTMFFCKSKPTCVSALMKILSLYESVSGQRINPQKSAVTFSAKTPEAVRNRVKETMEIYTEGGVGKYLGLPEQFGRRKRNIFASILDRIRQKSHSWTAKLLSGAGKQSLLTRFWWDANPEKRKMCWVAWETMALPKYAGGLRFRDIETFNDALLAKIGWRLIKEPNSLLARVLLGKYARNVSFMDCPVLSTASHGWRSVLAGRDILRRGLGWAVGNGEQINVWNAPWLSFKSPRQPIGPPPLESRSLMVSDLLCPLTNKWEIVKIRRFLPQYEDTILQIKTSSTAAPDTLLWLPEKSGVYSTKTGYRVGMTSDKPLSLENSPVNWLSHIWNVKTGPKLKDFLWRVVRKAIPVSSNLEKRGFPSFNCKTCGASEDDLHVFLKCPLAEEVWNLVPTQHRPTSALPNVAELIKHGSTFTPLPPTGLTSPLWPWVLWNLWKARNKLVFENRTFTAQEVVLKSIQDAKEWSQAQDLNRVSSQSSPLSIRTNHTSPCPPPPIQTGVLVCKVDAAWDNISGQCVLSDSLSLIKLLKNGGYQAELFGIIFISRNFNCEADSVAKSALAFAVTNPLHGG
ncbi:uncharacterized protein LOC106413463 [Brassica napus]|uniref:uncharacterized protein LOC106413463 n=1 Tax=Brassica napus TaxID=3708 RepID=UPI0006AA937A|nr:uncharacterized protein LOC106413463 [Brassica napus]